MRQRCQDAPARLAAIASRRPAWASEVTKRTPDRPRATRSAKNSFHAAPVSAVATRMPRTSRWPSPLTPVASSATALMTRPPSRTFMVSASAVTNVNGPASVRGRWRKSSTIESRSAAIRDTWDFESPSIPNVFTSLSIRLVLTPAR